MYASWLLSVFNGCNVFLNLKELQIILLKVKEWFLKKTLTLTLYTVTINNILPMEINKPFYQFYVSVYVAFIAVVMLLVQEVKRIVLHWVFLIFVRPEYSYFSLVMTTLGPVKALGYCQTQKTLNSCILANHNKGQVIPLLPPSPPPKKKKHIYIYRNIVLIHIWKLLSKEYQWKTSPKLCFRSPY